MRDYLPQDDGLEPADFDFYYDVPAGTAKDVAARVYIKVERDPKRAAVIQRQQDKAILGLLRWMREYRTEPEVEGCIPPLPGGRDTEGGDMTSAAAEPAHEITFEVLGYPPAKNEAKSMLAVEHRYAARVRLLLEATQRACAEHAFRPIDTDRVGLDVTLYAPAGQNPADATNYLGGIADVLEHKAHRGGSLEHLGELANVWLYRNDRQIKEVTYREIEANALRYVVTVRELGT